MLPMKMIDYVDLYDCMLDHTLLHTKNLVYSSYRTRPFLPAAAWLLTGPSFGAIICQMGE